MKKIFITGGSGFLGSHLINVLRKRSSVEITAPTSAECNLLDPYQVEKYNTQSFDYIYHLAAWTQAGDFCLKYPGDQWIKNQTINTNILKWWSSNQTQAKLIFMGTSCSYSTELELKEENYLLGEPIESLYTYALCKRMLLVGAKALSKQFGLKYLCLVPSTLYGNNYHDDGRQMHFIFDLVRKIVDAKNGGEVPTLWGDGLQEREIIHVDDFIDAWMSIENEVVNEVINIGAGYSYSIVQFAELISEICGYDTDLIKYDTSKYVGARSKCLDISKLKSMHKEFRNRDLKEGLEEVIHWYSNTKSYKQL